ncbi:MAG: APC family permease [bacterium]|nr:APC family permease [Candidatus Aquidulcis sp.]
MAADEQRGKPDWHDNESGEELFVEPSPDHLVASAAGSAPVHDLGKATTAARHFIFGQPISNAEEGEERLSKKLALPIFSSDAISSSAYASEEILIVLASAGASYLAFGPAVALAVGLLLAIVALSYRQVCFGFPKGGGAYAVAKSTLGTGPALIAASSLVIDYVLTAAVSTAAGIAAITSAVPELSPLRVELAIGALALLVLANLRGLRESGKLFAIPTYLFIFGALAVIGVGLIRIALGDPAVTWSQGVKVIPHGDLQLILPFLLLKAFAYGSVALTGTEAISDGVTAFKKPEAKNAANTMTIMSVLLATIFFGISLLAFAFGKVPQDVGGETLISQIARASFGDGIFYVVFQIATTGILLLAANTGFNGGPQLARILARDGFLPRQVGQRSDRLAYAGGILTIAVGAVVFLIATGALVTLLIPAYAIGVFVGFTISQTGMVVHWRKVRGDDWQKKALLNGIGATVTGVVLVIISLAKFAVGGWIIFVLVPVVAIFMTLVRRRYNLHERELAIKPNLVFDAPHRPRRIIAPFGEVNRSTVRAITLGRILEGATGELTAVRVVFDAAEEKEIRARFESLFPGVRLVTVESPFRAIVEPICHYLDEIEDEDAHLPPEQRRINVVMIPEYAGRHWWDRILHNGNGKRLRDTLLGRRNTVILDIPYRRDLE